MSNQLPVLVLSLTLWVFLGYRFLRAFARHRLTDRPSLYAWIVFFLCYLVVALDVPSVEQVVGEHFNGLPIAALARNLAILITAQFFFLATRHVDKPSPQVKRLFVWVNPLIMLFMVGLFVGMARISPSSSQVMTHSVKTIREAAMLLWTPLVFWPTLYQIWRVEKLRPMKLRYALSLMFYATFIIECASGLLWTFTVFFAPALEAPTLALDQATSIICLLQFVVMLFPFRWLVVIFYPAQLLLYFRLHRLRSTVRNFATEYPPVYQVSHNLARTADLELAIYQHVIEILDLYPSMSSAGKVLQREIQSAAESEPQYSELVKRLAAIRL
jgi:hypothetical protein